MTGFELFGGPRPCIGRISGACCGTYFCGPAHVGPMGDRTCLECRPAQPGTAFAEALLAAGFRLSGQHPTGDPHRSSASRR